MKWLYHLLLHIYFISMIGITSSYNATHEWAYLVEDTIILFQKTT